MLGKIYSYGTQSELCVSVISLQRCVRRNSDFSEIMFISVLLNNLKHLWSFYYQVYF